MSNKAGKISQIMGAVVDVSFEDNHLPEIMNRFKGKYDFQPGET